LTDKTNFIEFRKHSGMVNTKFMKDWVLVTRNSDCQNDNYKWENCQLGPSNAH